MYFPHGFIRLICRNNLTSIGVQPLSRRGIDIEYSTLCFARNKSNTKTATNNGSTLNAQNGLCSKSDLHVFSVRKIVCYLNRYIQ